MLRPLARLRQDSVPFRERAGGSLSGEPAMRIVFVSDTEPHEQPVVEVREPEP